MNNTLIPAIVDQFVEGSLLQNRIIYFCDDVDDIATSLICAKLEHLATVNNNPIKIILTSAGGSIFAALALYDTIMSLRNRDVKVIIEARGYAASAAAIILQAGTRRVATKNTQFLIHEVRNISGFFEERTVSGAQDEVKELERINDIQVNILSQRCNHTPDEIKKLCHKTDVWMNTEKALAWGLIDEVLN